MLVDEYRVVNHRNVTQSKLDGISRDARPVALKVAVDALLGDAQDAAAKVQQNLNDAPTLGRLVAVVCEDLRRVLDDCDDQLDVGNGVNHIEPHPGVKRPLRAVAFWRAEDDKDDSDDADDAAKEYAEDESARLVSFAGREPPDSGEEVLARGDYGHDDSVQRKGDIVELHGRREPLVAGGVLSANQGGVVEGGIGDGVRSEAWAGQFG